ncbi:peptide deformylase [Fulvivirgaceae bacterium QH1ED-6-2]|nr:peptide deformylase [Parachryseolinea silvisoli]
MSWKTISLLSSVVSYGSIYRALNRSLPSILAWTRGITSGQALQLFVVDSKSTYDSMDAARRQEYFPEDDTGIVETFINAQVVAQSDKNWDDEEGCLSIPSLSRGVSRPWSITVDYFDRSFIKQTHTFAGATARMIQHEYDHTRGVLYLDYLSVFTRQRMQRKLRAIVRGHIEVDYPMRRGL